MNVELKMIPTRIVLEYAFAAYRANDGYIKAGTIGKVTNKDLVEISVKEYLNRTAQTAYPFYIPNDFAILEINDEDRRKADGVDNHFKKYMLKSIGGKLNDFENSVYTAICSKEIPINSMGIVSYIPELIVRDNERREIEKTLKEEYRESAACNDNSVQGVMTVLSVYDFKTAPGDLLRVVMLGMDGNLYQFFDNKRKIDLNSRGRKFNISGRVKDISSERMSGLSLTTTRLNYVKVKKCQSQ